MDVLGHFIAECLNLERMFEWKARASDVYGAYRDWCADNGHEPFSQTRFATEMERERLKSQGARNCKACDALFMPTAHKAWTEAGEEVTTG